MHSKPSPLLQNPGNPNLSFKLRSLMERENEVKKSFGLRVDIRIPVTMLSLSAACHQVQLDHGWINYRFILYHVPCTSDFCLCVLSYGADQHHASSTTTVGPSGAAPRRCSLPPAERACADARRVRGRDSQGGGFTYWGLVGNVGMECNVGIY